MHSLAGTIAQTIGFALYLIVLVDYYYFLPERVARWEKSEALEDKKNLDRYKKAVHLYKVNWGMRVLALIFAIWLVSALLSLI